MQVRVHALALIQPILLGRVGREGLAGLVLDWRDVYIKAGTDLLT